MTRMTSTHGTRVSLLAVTWMLTAAIWAPAVARGLRQEKTAGEVYKSVKVLKDVPESQLLQAMFFMEASLGVSCNHCHVDFVNFEKDDRPTKDTARRMILLTRELNDKNFGGRSAVTCNTCHRGQAKPAAPLAFKPTTRAATTQSAAAPQVMPSVDDVFQRYLTASGGTLALGRITTLSVTGTKTSSEGWTAPLEILEKRAAQGSSAQEFVTTFQLQGKPWSQACDGTIGWKRDNHGVHPMAGRDLALAQLRAGLLRPTTLRSMFDALAVTGSEVVGDRVTVVVEGVLHDAGPARLFFDVASGWLVRVTTPVASPFGEIPEAYAVDDYRRVGDVTLPFSISHLKPDTSDLERFNTVQANVAIDEAKFKKPDGL